MIDHIWRERLDMADWLIARRRGTHSRSRVGSKARAARALRLPIACATASAAVRAARSQRAPRAHPETRDALEKNSLPLQGR